MQGYRKLRLLLSSLLLPLFLSLLLCETAHAGAVVRVGGTGSGLPVLRVLAKEFNRIHRDITVTVVPSLGSAGGIAAVTQGALELSVSARPLKVAELHTGAKAVEFAHTPFVFAVHKNVPISDVTTNDLVCLFSGKTPTWSNGMLVRPILRPATDTDTDIIMRISPAVARALQAAHLRPGMTMAATNDESAEAVTIVPGAFTATTLTEMLTEKRPARILSYNGIKPTLTTLANGKYPLSKTLYLVTPGRPSAAAREFATFIMSQQAHAILTATGNLPASASHGPRRL